MNIPEHLGAELVAAFREENETHAAYIDDPTRERMRDFERSQERVWRAVRAIKEDVTKGAP